MDRYKEDLDRTKDIQKKVQMFMQERQQAEAAGKSTSSIDYKLKAENAKLTKEIINLEKLIYEYENPNVSKHDGVD